MSADDVGNELLESLSKWLHSDHSQRLQALPKDYFSWGRDKRHKVDDTEKLDVVPGLENAKSLLRSTYKFFKYFSIGYTAKLGKYETFNTSYLLMSNSESRELFSELLVMQMLGEERFRLSIFDDSVVTSYEEASSEILASEESLCMYGWVLKRIDFPRPNFSAFTTPVFASLVNQGRVYRYSRNGVEIGIDEKDIVIDCGVGWGDTTVYFAAATGGEGAVHSFDVLEEGLVALQSQLDINPSIKNVTSVLSAVSNVDGEDVYISSLGPGSHVTTARTGRAVKTLTLDSYVEFNELSSVDFIKMDIEGAEIPALHGARKTISKFKPKLAISVYHRWDDLREIPQLINTFRDDYSFYLDCTTGFGGEAVLYCR